MKRNAFNLVVLVVVLLSTLLYSGCQKKSEPISGSIKGEVVYVKGEVSINNKQIAEGDTVSDKAVIKTGKDSECEIIFNEKNIIHIAGNTSATLDFSGAIKQVSLEYGAVSSILKKLEWAADPDADAFRVKTNIAVLGVRGTAFCIWTNNERSYICDCNGVIYLEDEAGNNKETIISTHHTSRVFTKENGKIVSVPGGLEFHTDADVERLGLKIGYTIDWTVAD